MYLEFSERITGKTSRLLKAAVEQYYITRRSVIIVVCSATMVSYLEHFVPYGINIVTPLRLPTTIFRSTTRLFYDEFGFMDNIVYNSRNYYATTLLDSSDRCQKHVEKLLSLNNGEFREYTSFTDYTDYKVSLNPYTGPFGRCTQLESDNILDMFRID